MIKSWKAMIKISIPTSFNTVMIQFVLLVFNKIMASFGVAFIAGFGVAIKIEAFFTVLLIAVGASMPSFIGQNFGAKRHDRIKTALNYNVGFAFIWSLFCFITFFFFGKLFISFFVKDEIIINHAYLYLLITSISYLGVELMYASHSLFNSIDKSYYSSFYTFIQTTVIIATVYFCSLKMGAIGGLIGLTIGRIAMGLIEFINAKLLLKEDVDTGRFVYLKPHFIFKKIKDVLSLNSYIKDKIKDWEM
jgi:Na+-driven multidrug efflux pump